MKGTKAPIFEFVLTSLIREFLSEFEIVSFNITEVITWKYCSNAEFKFDASGKFTPLAALLSTSSITFPSKLIQEASQITLFDSDNPFPFPLDVEDDKVYSCKSIGEKKQKNIKSG